jgi:hypothetical protein
MQFRHAADARGARQDSINAALVRLSRKSALHRAEPQTPIANFRVSDLQPCSPVCSCASERRDRASLYPHLSNERPCRGSTARLYGRADSHDDEDEKAQSLYSSMEERHYAAHSIQPAAAKNASNPPNIECCCGTTKLRKTHSESCKDAFGLGGVYSVASPCKALIHASTSLERVTKGPNPETRRRGSVNIHGRATSNSVVGSCRTVPSHPPRRPKSRTAARL